MSSTAEVTFLPWRVSLRTTSALPSINPSIEVKYLTSLPAGAALGGEGFIWAKARSDEAVIRPIRRIRSARMRNPSKDRTGRYRKASSIPVDRNQAGPSLANLGTLRQKRRPPGGGLGRSAMSGSGRPLERDDFSSNRHPALSFWLSMIFSENRFPPRIKRGA